MKNTIDQKAREGYTLELGKLIDESFATFKKTFLVSGLGMLIVSVIMVLFYVGTFQKRVKVAVVDSYSEDC